MLSKTTEYALRAITCLAGQAACDKSPSPAEEVAGIIQVPRRYLHRVMQNLAASGLVESRYGAHGGYLLAKLVVAHVAHVAHVAMSAARGTGSCLRGDRRSVCESHDHGRVGFDQSDRAAE